MTSSFVESLEVFRDTNVIFNIPGHKVIPHLSFDNRKLIVYTAELDPGSIRSHSSNKAFLFTLYNTHGYRPQKLSLIESKSDHATYSRNDVGPLFGFTELLIVDNANSNTGSKTGTSDVYQAPSGCPRSGFCTILAGSYNSWLVSDIEVFYETI